MHRWKLNTEKSLKLEILEFKIIISEIKKSAEQLNNELNKKKMLSETEMKKYWKERVELQLQGGPQSPDLMPDDLQWY